jgi:hypothetical protein
LLPPQLLSQLQQQLQQLRQQQQLLQQQQRLNQDGAAQVVMQQAQQRLQQMERDVLELFESCQQQQPDWQQ